jgi:hypothetical protein
MQKTISLCAHRVRWVSGGVRMVIFLFIAGIGMLPWRWTLACTIDAAGCRAVLRVPLWGVRVQRHIPWEHLSRRTPQKHTIRVRTLSCTVTVGCGEPTYTAMAAGIIWALLGCVMPPLCKRMRTHRSRAHIAVACRPNELVLSARIDLCGYVSIFQLLLMMWRAREAIGASWTSRRKTQPVNS